MQTQAIIRHIVQWLKDYAEQALAKGFVVGISGGIDSAVVSTLAAQTGLSVLLLEMPIRQKSDQVNRAQEHMGRLKKRYPNVKAQSVDLTPAFDTFADTVDVSETEFQVYALAAELDVSEDIQKAVPTDGLWDIERTDEEQMGASYPELEWAMSVYNSHKPEDFEGRQREVLTIYTRLHKAMQHKVNPIPVCKIPEELF